jgi:RNA polymerase sigma factor (sigma-70 family)
MKIDVMSDAETLDDARLVKLGLNGDRDAFGQLVTRYQSPVCALAYSACGNLSHSQDLAQETFVTAWRKLSDLKEPAKFKAWLYGIARNLIHNAFRQQTRNPLAAAEPLDECLTTTATLSNPTEQAISKEEEGILWRSLEHIPETYREPLILFYREHQSIERVAAILELSEEVVRQRLSRGRKLLHERVIAFVEGALEQTAPGPAFTLGVLSALPHLTVAAGSSAVGGTVLKGSAAGKAAAMAGLFATVKVLLIKFLPAVAGTWLMLKLPESQRERKFARKTWALLWIGAVLYPLGLLLAVYAGRNGYWHAHPQMLTVVILGSAFGFVAVVGPYALWMSRTLSRIQKEEAKQSVNPRFISQSQPYEYRSPRTFLGLPLVHVCFNCIEAGKTLPAKGWIAVGNKAYGILFASGSIAVGCVSMGGLAIGLFALGGFGIGLFAFGGMSLGFAAIGGAAAGYVAFGGGAIGWLGASGGATLARHFALGGGAIAEHANDQAAQAFMQSNVFFRYEWIVFNTLILISWLLPPALSLYFKRKRERKGQAAKSTLSAMVLMTIVAAFALTAGPVQAGEAKTAPSFVVKITGKGRPIIFIPGLSCAGAVWDGSVAHLKDHYECHVLTLAGFAGQPRIEPPFLETVCTDLAKYIREHKLDHPVIIGHSLGGFIALRLASEDPDIVGPLVVVDAMPFLPAGFNPAATATTMKPPAEQMRASLSTGGEQFISQSESGIKTMVTKPADVDLVMSWARRTDPVAAGNAMYELFTTDLREELGKITSPALVLISWIAYQDHTTREQVEHNYQSQYARLKHSRLVMADHARHFIMLDDPAWFYGQIDGFLASHTP